MRALKTATRAAFLSAFVLTCVRVAFAQPQSPDDSGVELLVERSERVVRAVVEDVVTHDLKEGLHRYVGRNRYQTVYTRVLETLKGEHSDRLQFVQNGDFGPIRLGELQKNKQEVLLFLEPWVRSLRFNRPTGGYAFTRFPLVVQNAAVLNAEDVQWAHANSPMLSSDLIHVKTAEQLVDTIKSYLKSRANHGLVVVRTITLPDKWNRGMLGARFSFPVEEPAEEPVLDFSVFKKRYARQKPPGEKLKSYDRVGRGYVGVHSLELMAIDCDAIVRGVIEDSCFLGIDYDPTLNVFGVKLRVLETLKGKCAKQIGVYVSYPPDLQQLQRDRQELVLFLRCHGLSGPAAALGYQMRDGLHGLWDDSAIVLDDQRAEVLFSDLTWHREPKKILDRLRVVAERERRMSEELQSRAAAAGIPPQRFLQNGEGAERFAHCGMRPPVFSFHPPESIAANSVIAGNEYSRVYLPVERELEANARKWLKSENKDRRWVGAQALIYFKSDENAAILKTMLDDDAAWGRIDMLHMTRISWPYSPKFLVRWEAWHTLAGWGFDVPKTSFGESRRRND